MALIHQLIAENLPQKRRQSPRGWIMFNCPCCVHRGHRTDTRMRGNMLILPDGIIAYNCYNCEFKTVFDNVNLSRNFENLLDWLNIPTEDIRRIKLEVLQNKMAGVTGLPSHEDLDFLRDFKEVGLPEDARPIEAVMEDDELTPEFLACIDYLTSRGNAIAGGWDYYWSSSTKWNLNQRIIIPFYYRNKIVGWTARFAGKPLAATPRYYNSDLQTGYLFNCDAIDKGNRKYTILVEGPFDAIAIDGVAALGSKLSRQQLSWINSTDREIIVLPDRQRKNQGLIDIALEQEWSVSFPEWEDHIKDAADASCAYGRLFALRTIIDSRTKSPLQIAMKRKMYRA
jgi:hypothetical protein